MVVQQRVLGVASSGAVVDDPMSIPGTVGQWITENLVRLKEVVQPYLDLVMAGVGILSEGAEQTG